MLGIGNFGTPCRHNGTGDIINRSLSTPDGCVLSPARHAAHRTVKLGLTSRFEGQVIKHPISSPCVDCSKVALWTVKSQTHNFSVASLVPKVIVSSFGSQDFW